MISLGI